jgi:hypothetical protein
MTPDDAVEARSRHKTHFCRMGAAASRWMSCKVHWFGGCLGLLEGFLRLILPNLFLQSRCAHIAAFEAGVPVRNNFLMQRFGKSTLIDGV